MTRYRKKPVEIEAILWTGSNSDVVKAAGCPAEVLLTAEGPRLSIQTLEGTILASPGDYIIRGVAGEWYPCKPDIFTMTYELA
jgi:hypothetical protein